MQMLGEEIFDPHGIEHEGSVQGLGLLPVRTTMQPRKVTNMASGRMLAPLLFGRPVPEIRLSGYEIHIGETRCSAYAQPFAEVTRPSDAQQQWHSDGCISADGRIFGTYLHGLFDEDGFRHAFLAAARAFHRLVPVDSFNNWKEKRENSLNRLANAVCQSLDMSRIFSWAGLTYQSQIQMEVEDKRR
jgi:adenosylcobyric acid synthase